MSKPPAWKDVPATRCIAGAFGLMLAVAGFEHGLFESMQGNHPIHGFFIQAIGPGQRWWVYGTEDAFTLIHNYLATGICAMALSLLVAAWSIGFIHKRYGRSVFLGLMVLLTLAGGGVGHVAFFVPVWAYATRINQPLRGWNRLLPEVARKPLAKLWFPALALAFLCWLPAIEIAVFGYVPGLTDPVRLQAICWSFLLLALFFLNLAFIAGFAHELERQPTPR